MSERVITYAVTNAAVWTPACITFTIVTLRAFVRVKIRRFGLEAFLMAIACCFIIAGSIGQQIQDQETFGINTYSTNRLQVNALTDAIEECFLTASYVGKLSVALLLLRLIGTTSKPQRIIIITSASVLTVTFTILVILCVFPICGFPESAAWKHSTCFANEKGNYVLNGISGSTFALVDIIYSLIPSTFISKVPMTVPRKTLVISVLSLGWIASIFGVLRIVAVFCGPPITIPWGNVLLMISFVLEANLVLICGSLPTLVPLLTYWRTGKPLRPKKETMDDAELLDKESGLLKAPGAQDPNISRHTSDTPQAPSPTSWDSNDVLPALRIEKRTSVVISSEPIV